MENEKLAPDAFSHHQRPTKNGQVDFYIPSERWGLELLREGNRLAEHSSRFARSGAYGRDLELDDFILLDCHTTQPKQSYGLA